MLERAAWGVSLSVQPKYITRGCRTTCYLWCTLQDEEALHDSSKARSPLHRTAEHKTRQGISMGVEYVLTYTDNYFTCAWGDATSGKLRAVRGRGKGLGHS